MFLNNNKINKIVILYLDIKFVNISDTYDTLFIVIQVVCCIFFFNTL